TSSLLRTVLGACGGALLLFLSARAFRSAFSPARVPVPAPTGRAHFRAGAMISLANPHPLASRLAPGPGRAARGHGQPPVQRLAVFLTGFLLACGLYCPAVSAVIAAGRRAVGPGTVRVLHGLSGAMLLTVAARLGYELVSRS